MAGCIKCAASYYKHGSDVGLVFDLLLSCRPAAVSVHCTDLNLVWVHIVWVCARSGLCSYSLNVCAASHVLLCLGQSNCSQLQSVKRLSSPESFPDTSGPTAIASLPGLGIVRSLRSRYTMTAPATPHSSCAYDRKDWRKLRAEFTLAKHDSSMRQNYPVHQVTTNFEPRECRKVLGMLTGFSLWSPTLLLQRFPHLSYWNVVILM